MTKKTKSAITEKHFVRLSEAASARTTISVFGKIVKDAGIKSGTSGVLHPLGREEDLHLAQVVGYSDGNRCVTLTEPQIVALPTADGPADGCGWDPQEYVVWKNLPKAWKTLHLQSTTRTLHSALTSSLSPLATAPTKPCVQLPQAISLVRSCGNVGSDVPLSTPLGQLFPSPTARNSFCQCVANGVPIDRSQIPCGATNTLQDVVDAIAC